MSDSSSEDDSAHELSIEADRAINVALMKAITGNAKDDEVSVESELKEGDKEKLTKENKDALEKISAADPQDETDKFLSKFFSERKWEGKGNAETDEVSPDEDLEDIDSGLEFEKRYNFRHEQKGFSLIQSNPRRVEGEERNTETARKRKRRREAEESAKEREALEQQLDEIDKKYAKLAEENGGHLTSEQLSAYADETSKIYLIQQKGAFPYVEVEADGSIEKSLKILNDEDTENKEGGDEEPPNPKNKKDKKPNIRGKGNHPMRGGRRIRGGFRGGHNKSGVSESRLNTYFAHRHN
ncbi:hypothetical protein GPJ56_006586 [Histomonas meleagridis]|uniref:uncharacterized protein n=1 Tax=Histomonas meleagridis TaxID=135588 RepID=UPI003559C3A0|nr:hypothetical protein GPJ56_006586 [Histomonas meleagridis]KAH0798357.1 hypothetical protein GO595_008906 [Histomonas meleagridis]